LDGAAKKKNIEIKLTLTRITGFSNDKNKIIQVIVNLLAMQLKQVIITGKLKWIFLRKTPYYFCC
jgi:hypothetical protein